MTYYREIATAAGGTQLYAYLYPERTGVRVTPVQLASLAGECGLAGAKLSGAAGAALGEYAAAAGLRGRMHDGPPQVRAVTARRYRPDGADDGGNGR